MIVSYFCVLTGQAAVGQPDEFAPNTLPLKDIVKVVILEWEALQRVCDDKTAVGRM